jgi:hypothetical protein
MVTISYIILLYPSCSIAIIEPLSLLGKVMTMDEGDDFILDIRGSRQSSLDKLEEQAVARNGSNGELTRVSHSRDRLRVEYPLVAKGAGHSGHWWRSSKLTPMNPPFHR